jgi:hypothetical protein
MEAASVEPCPGCTSAWIHALISAQTLPRPIPAPGPGAIGTAAVRDPEEERSMEPESPLPRSITKVAPIHPGEPPRAPGTLLDMLG